MRGIAQSATHHAIYSALQRCWLQRQLFLKLLRRDFSERYRGSYLGFLWALLLPILSLLVFTFFFGVVFQVRWGGNSSGSLTDLALTLFIGLALYNFLAECLTRAPAVIVNHANYVKHVIFPLEMLPAILVASAFLVLLITLLAILLMQAVIGTGLSLSILLAPLALLPLLLFLLGMSWFLAALGVYIRDLQMLVMPLTQLLMFLSPVFYPISALPAALRPWLQLNPLALSIEQMRGLLLFNQPLHWPAYLLSLFAAILTLLFGFWWFVRTRKGFADVL